MYKGGNIPGVDLIGDGLPEAVGGGVPDDIRGGEIPV